MLRAIEPFYWLVIGFMLGHLITIFILVNIPVGY